jgi:hypothetical protein
VMQGSLGSLPFWHLFLSLLLPFILKLLLFTPKAVWIFSVLQI